MPYPDLITTERLRLLRWDAELHFPALAAINTEPAAVMYLNEGTPYTPEESHRQSERFANQWDQHGFGLFAVEAAGAIVGFAGVTHPIWFPDYAHEFEAGWRLHPCAWGHGYATEAAHAAVDAAFTHLELARIISIIDPANTPSIAVSTRLGMTPDVTVPHPQRPGSVTIYARPRPPQ
jgi:RimJ/RimL family protein N-acetyltransferase